MQAKRYDTSTLNRIYSKNKNFINIVGFIAQEPCYQQNQWRGRSRGRGGKLREKNCEVFWVRRERMCGIVENKTKIMWRQLSH